jgi:2-hydroxy-3-keto-5-methylthiopentenyl-1-phosphate phosphatase
VTLEEDVPIEKLILDAFKPKWSDFKANTIRLDGTLSKVDKLVQLAEVGNETNEENILKFFEKDIEVRPLITRFSKIC